MKTFWCLFLLATFDIAAARTVSWGAKEVEAALEKARKFLETRNDVEGHSARVHGRTAGASCPGGCLLASFRHQQSRRVTKKAMEIAHAAQIFEEVINELRRSSGDSWTDDAFKWLEAMDLKPTGLYRYCPLANFTCDPTREYREADGRCNNLQNPGWGAANSCMNRLLPPAYQDGISSPRVAADGSPLPNARLVSYTVHPSVSNPAIDITHMVMQLGQFIDHDFALAPLMPDPGEIVELGNPNQAVDCCSPERRHASNCFSIDIPRDDPFFARFGQTCMNVPRSAPCTRCALGQREQQDILTSYLDASQVYGSSTEDTMRLRAMRQGMMLHQNDVFVGQLLPLSFHANEDRCSIPSKGKICFRAGDERVNEHPGLTAMHTTFLRQHNRIARTLAELNSQLSDEEIFQRAKRILESQWQHIVYSEWLPIVVGPEAMSRFGLTPQSDGFTTYDPSVDATMLNEFATAAFRLGHTLIDGTFSANYLGRPSFELEDNFFYPFEFYNGLLEPLLRGLMLQRAQTYDRGVTDGVTNHLYRLRNESFGLDLIALNLQRAREHGIRPYVDYVHFCTGIQLTSFDELKRYMDNVAVENYKRLYNDVRDVDLFTAGISEFSVPGGIVGPTFTCILGHMFHRLKYGDRFYYEHASQAGSLSPGQLDEIRKITFAKIICENSDMAWVTPNVFRPSGLGNSETACFSIPETNYALWA
ncbi:chorion peroxidase-like isoform X2 [Rhipicephalus microplus]|uniref:chorion peroxidase-like isoform X2 n=1 Tax=Rhipicephalus microplus TaxID=6941 RepID=UPI003F6D35F6